MIWTSDSMKHQSGAAYVDDGLAVTALSVAGDTVAAKRQRPRASQYRSGYRNNWVTRVWWAVLLVGGLS